MRNLIRDRGVYMTEVADRAEEAAAGDDCGTAHMVLLDAANGDEATARLVETAMRVGRRCPMPRRLSGLGSSSVEHADAAVREITDGFEPFIEQAVTERMAGDCDSAADSLFAAARVFGGIKAHAQAAGLRFPQPQLEQLEIEVDHFVEKCVIKRKR